MHPDLPARYALLRLGIRCQLAAPLAEPRCWLVQLPNGKVRRCSGWVLRLMVEKRRTTKETRHGSQ